MRMPPHICGVILATSLTVALAMPAYVATAQRKGMALVPNHHRCVEVLQLEKVEMDAQSGEVKVVLGRLGPASGTEDRVCRFASAAARLLRAYTMQLEAYRRLRHGGDQYVHVEHVHISEGAQAVIGNVRPQESGRAEAPEAQKHRDPDEDAT